MTTRTAPLIAVLAALAFVCLPLRADAEDFTLKLEAAVQEMSQQGEARIRSYPSSAAAKDLHKLMTGVGDQLLRLNEAFEIKNVPVKERLPILRQLYLTEMRKIHQLKPDKFSSVKYNERNQSLRFARYEFDASGRYSGGSIAQKLFWLLEFHKIEPDPFARQLNDALSRLDESWRRFQQSNPALLSSYLHEHMLPKLPPSPAPTSPPKYRSGVDSMVAEIRYELSKLDVELSLKGRPDEERVEKLRGKMIEIVKEFDNLTRIVQFDEEAAELSFYDNAGSPQLDSAGAPLTYQIPFALLSALNIQTSAKSGDSRMCLLMIGAAAVLLLLVGGVYLAMRFNSTQEENENAASN